MKTFLIIIFLIPNLIWSSSDVVMIDQRNDLCYSKSEEEFLKCPNYSNIYGTLKGGSLINMINQKDLNVMYKKCSTGNKKICSQIGKIFQVRSNNYKN
jgi:hypothetical protein